MRVLVLDGHQMVAQSIAGLLSEVGGWDVVGVCSTNACACEVIRREKPRLLVLDGELGGASTREPALLLKQLNPAARLLFVTARGDAFQPCPALEPITIGVLDQASPWQELLQTVQHWLQQEQPADLQPPHACAAQLQALHLLSPRELRLLHALGQGLLNKEVAVRLGLSVKTVESYRKSIAAKLGISGAELVRLAAVARCFRWSEAQHAQL